MSNDYTYDLVDNVLSVNNTANGMSHSYNCDGLYRLISTTGSYTGADNKTASYTLNMQYDNLHNIVSKKQHVEQSNIVFNGTLKAGYDLTYNYDKPLQISTLQDENYRTKGDVQKDKIANYFMFWGLSVASNDLFYGINFNEQGIGYKTNIPVTYHSAGKTANEKYIKSIKKYFKSNTLLSFIYDDKGYYISIE
jgi:hypothetical protein